MKQNFDDTQFVTFDINGSHSKATLEKMVDIWSENFSVILEDEIRDVKKEYFEFCRQKYFIEIKDELFIGEFEGWGNVINVPEKIQVFERQVKRMAETKDVSNVKVILTEFAEEGETTNAEITVNKNEILKGLFAMSRMNFEVWADNLILTIV